MLPVPCSVTSGSRRHFDMFHLDNIIGHSGLITCPAPGKPSCFPGHRHMCSYLTIRVSLLSRCAPARVESLSQSFTNVAFKERRTNINRKLPALMARDVRMKLCTRGDTSWPVTATVKHCLGVCVTLKIDRSLREAWVELTSASVRSSLIFNQPAQRKSRRSGRHTSLARHSSEART